MKTSAAVLAQTSITVPRTPVSGGGLGTLTMVRRGTTPAAVPNLLCSDHLCTLLVCAPHMRLMREGIIPFQHHQIPPHTIRYGGCGHLGNLQQIQHDGWGLPPISVRNSYSTFTVFAPCFSVTLHSQSASVFSSHGMCLKHTCVPFANFILRRASVTVVTRAYYPGLARFYMNAIIKSLPPISRIPLKPFSCGTSNSMCSPKSNP